jgi:hypothetical protein
VRAAGILYNVTSHSSRVQEIHSPIHCFARGRLGKNLASLIEKVINTGLASFSSTRAGIAGRNRRRAEWKSGTVFWERRPVRPGLAFIS